MDMAALTNIAVTRARAGVHAGSRALLSQMKQQLDEAGNLSSDSFTSFVDEATGLSTMFFVYLNFHRPLFDAALAVYCINVGVRLIVGIRAMYFPPSGVQWKQEAAAINNSSGDVVLEEDASKLSQLFRSLMRSAKSMLWRFVCLLIIMIEPVLGIRIIGWSLEAAATLSPAQCKQLETIKEEADNSRIEAAFASADAKQKSTMMLEAASGTGGSGADSATDAAMAKIHRMELAAVEAEVEATVADADLASNRLPGALMQAERAKKRRMLFVDIAQLTGVETVELTMAAFEDAPELGLGIWFVALGGLDKSSSSDIVLFITSMLVSVFHASKCVWSWWQHQQIIRQAKEQGDTAPAKLNTFDGYLQVVDLEAAPENDANAPLLALFNAQPDADDADAGVGADQAFGLDYNPATTETVALRRAADQARAGFEAELERLDAGSSLALKARLTTYRQFKGRQERTKDEDIAAEKRAAARARQRGQAQDAGPLLPEQTSPVQSAAELAAIVDRLNAAEGAWAGQYRGITAGNGNSVEASIDPEHGHLNRYRNIVAYDHSRVKVEPGPHTHNSDYMNASFIDGYYGPDVVLSPDKYIAAQGPVPDSQAAYWHMVWENSCQVIAMVTGEVEGNKLKCHRYWPENTDNGLSFGDFNVEMTEVEAHLAYIARCFKVTNRADGESRHIFHYQYIAWPDHGVPETSELLEYLYVVRAHQGTGPMLVHCSAGAGRTGVLIAADMIIDSIDATGTVDILGTVNSMRRSRNFVVQQLVQYQYLHKLIVDVLDKRQFF